MHELSLAGGIVRVVEDAAAREHFQRVSQLRVEAGALSGVD
ncbi:MAG TPA: hydrogenase/urease maturation nickel metallochaperone HypA, partial [Burkholderiaceae bacterium]|nr:hydrogenase/urease maturation nickel metallochaperone HypA [Burkholderiaceae bacterium]